MMYAPNLRAVAPGSEPSALERLLMIGKTIPPARAVLDGVAGEMMKSLAVMA